MSATALSEPALSLLRHRMAGEWVGVTEENRAVYREVVKAELMMPLNTFLNEKEGHDRPTEAACDRYARQSPGVLVPSFGASTPEI